jgi:RNA polymerase sigma-70 factor (ECF subfamily)
MDEHEQEALCRIAGGDAGGLEYLVARYQRKAVQTAFLITHDEALAEDVAQDVFVRLLLEKGIRTYDPQRPFEPYLMSSMVHAALNAVEKTARWQPLPEGENGLEERLVRLLQRAAGVEEQVEFNQLKGEIYTALGQMPPRQRAAIVQRYYLEMSEQEMAAALQAAPGTVKWLLNAARTRLRGLLAERQADED